jgi:para-aminobenzoate N-oxygenase AurF
MTIQHAYSYEATLKDSLKVHWTVDEVIGGGKQLDWSRPFLPDSLARTKELRSLSAAEKLTLNHIRGATYLHLFGLVEEFILPFVIDRARDGHAQAKTKTRAFLSFAEEEAKHQQLFERFSAEFRRGFSTPLELIGPASAIAEQVLGHSVLSVAILILHLEWLTQRHYIESVKTDEKLDPLFVDLLTHHWQEEAQHAKLDTLIISELAERAPPAEVDAAIEEFLAIGGILEGGLRQQVEFDLTALEKAIGRSLPEAEKQNIREVQIRSYRYTFLVSGLEQKNFVEAIASLSARGLENIKATAAALS